MATLWLRRAARSGTWWQAWVVVVATAVTAVVAALPARALDDDPIEPPPVLGCLSRVRGSMWAWPPEVMDGQSTTVNWGISYIPYGCTGVTVRVVGPGLYSTASSGSRTLVPVPASNGYAMYEFTAYKNGQQVPLDNLAVKITPLTSTAYGRKTVHIKYNWQVQAFVDAIATPNTTVRLADNLNLDLTGRQGLHIAYGVHILGGRSSTKPGPRLFTTAIRTAGPQPLFAIGEYQNADGVRISGVRIDGGDMGIAGNGATQDDDSVTPIGITVNSSVNVEIGNNEIYGWSGTAIQVKDTRDGGRIGLRSRNMAAVWIHDNYIHHNRRYRHEGYGVATTPGAYALIERNVFDYNRHALESSGEPETGYRAYSNLLLTGGGENTLATHTHQFDVHGTASCGFPLDMDAYCGPAGEYFDYRYNTLLYTAGDVIKVRGEPAIGADVTRNVFANGGGYSPISQTEGDNLAAWNNTFHADVFLSSYKTQACDFDGNGESDNFLATGATWWYESKATGQFYYLHTSTKMVHELAFNNVNGRCDVTVPAAGTVFRGGRAAGGGDTATLTAVPQRTDLVWQPPYTGPGTGGQVLLWRMHPVGHYVAEEVPVDLIAESTIGTALGIDTNGVLAGTSDFNGDGAPDLLWWNGPNGAPDSFVSVTLLDGSSTDVSVNVVVPGPLVRSAGAASGVAARRGILPSSTQLAGIGDFNADGRADILWRRQNGQLELWFAGESGNRALVNYNNDLDIDVNGVAHPKEAPVPVDWQVRGVGDFNGDGFSDIVWFSDAEGKAAIWYMQHGMHTGEAWVGGAWVGPDWDIHGVGDFDGDGRADILWRHIGGGLSMWFQGIYPSTRWEPTRQNLPGQFPEPALEIQGVGDFNADGRADILWRHTTTGAVSIWILHGDDYLGESAPLPMDPDWQLHGLLAQGFQRLELQ